MSTVPPQMTAITIREPGGPDVLVPQTRPAPSPGAEEVLVKVAAAGVNRPDVMQRQGLYPPPPGASEIPGLEIAGEVVALGHGVSRFKLGDKVTALVAGGGVRGGQVSGEYRGSGSLLDDEGWFHTRDRAHFDDDGYLFISGRTDDTIIRGGENIAPAEIEDVLVEHPAVKDVAVVGVPDDEWGARIVAVVVAAQEVAVDELRDYVRSRLRGSRTPDEVTFRVELPRTPTGKVIRRELVTDLLPSSRP